jgi:hypothetical protein
MYGKETGKGKTPCEDEPSPMVRQPGSAAVAQLRGRSVFRRGVEPYEVCVGAHP